MKNSNKFLFLITIALFISCSDKPSSSLKKEQYEIINKNVKTFLGESYEAINFVVETEGYTDETKTKYEVNLTFDLNKPVLFNDMKQIPCRLIFEKNEKNDWVCTFNSANLTGFFNFLN